MLLSPATELPTGPNWVYEPKVDGFRMLLIRRSNSLHIVSRRGKDWTVAFPELHPLRHGPHFILDGELVVLADGRPDFELMQRRAVQNNFPHLQARKLPASFYAFDLVSLDAVDLCHLP